METIRWMRCVWSAGQAHDCMCVLIYQMQKLLARKSGLDMHANNEHRTQTCRVCNVTDAAVCSLSNVHRIVSRFFRFVPMPQSRTIFCVDWNLFCGSEEGETQEKKKSPTKFDAGHCVCGSDSGSGSVATTKSLTAATTRN